MAAPGIAQAVPDPRAATRIGVVAGVVALAVAIAYLASIRNSLLYFVGASLGVAFVLGGLGFAGPWRAFIVHRKASGLVATYFLLALASIAFIPVLASLDGAIGNLAPTSLSVLLGAFLFGIGMQLGGGCGSGVLIASGAGSRHQLYTLAFFIPGSLIGSLHVPWWNATAPSLGVIDITDWFGVAGAVAVHVLAFAALAALAIRLSGRRHSPGAWRPTRRQLIGCVAVVLLALATLYISGRMWSVTFGHALWGAKLADLAGFDVAATTFWSFPYPANALANSVLADVTSVMNIGLLAGVAALTLWRNGMATDSYNWRRFIAAAAAGLLMGYGARLSFGCNIGALLSGSASGSLHAWLWFAAAWAGSHAGIRLRPRLDLAN